MVFLMSSPVFTSINVHIPPLLERRADSTPRLALQGKPTPPIIATLGISLVDVSEGRSIFEDPPACGWRIVISPATGHITLLHPVAGLGRVALVVADFSGIRDG